MHYQFGEISLSRVEYMSLPVPPELLGLREADVSPWGFPWVQDGQVLISAAAWIVEVEGKRVALDPVQAVDVVLRADAEAEQHHQTAIADKLTDSGYALESIDQVLMTHIEGVGMVAKKEGDDWRPFFPNAKIFISEAQLKAFGEMEKVADDPTHQCWQSLIDQGAVETFADGSEVLPGVTADVTGFHCDGHTVFHFNSGELTFMGHLAVSPVHMTAGPCEALNQTPVESYEVLQKVIADKRQVIGPLWPEPGIGRWTGETLE